MLEQKIIAFDVDGTIFDTMGFPRRDVIELIWKYYFEGWSVWIWSGAGKDNARRASDTLGLPLAIRLASKIDGIVVDGQKVIPDIAIDDMDVKLGVINIKI